jgi:hypothetical protein
MGMKAFMKIGSIPMDLLKEDFPKRAIFFTISHIKSGICKSDLIEFLRIEIKRVGNELFLVIS